MKILRIVFVILFISGGETNMVLAQNTEKNPNVAGAFYPADANQLKKDIQGYLEKADVKPYSQSIDVIIAPHAGYYYSAGVAAYSFKAASLNSYKTIILLGPTHYYDFDGVAIWPVGSFKTPLGSLSVDEELASSLMKLSKQFVLLPNIFDKDHVLEVEMPFIQQVFPQAKIVPLIMSRSIAPQAIAEVAAAFATSVGGRKDVLLLVSSDLAHYHQYNLNNEIDKRGLDAVEAMDVQTLWDGHAKGEMEIDGFQEVITSILYAKKRGADKAVKLKHANSGDITGEKDKVVGYAAIVMYKEGGEASSAGEESSLNVSQKRRLLDIARKTLDDYISTGKKYDFKETDLRLLEKEEGAFVTLTEHGRLRGCIGNIIGSAPLSYLVRDMAISSSTEDLRFKPVKEDELKNIEIEISVLSRPRVVKSFDEIELGKHGVIISRGSNRGVFLPQVATETGWSKEKFLSELCFQKAGLPADCWKDSSTKIEVFTADVFSEKDIGS